MNLRALADVSSLFAAVLVGLVVAPGCKDDSGGGGSHGGADLSVGGNDKDGGTTPDFGPLDPGCATVTAAAKLNKVDLVFLVDRSGSMGDGVNGDRTKKWDPVTSALKTFFADPKSKGLRASLEFFPADGNDVCNSSGYYFPAKEMTPLPATDFVSAIDAIAPKGETPTLPAIIGVIDYVVDQMATSPSDRAAIVLVTDGEPAGCESSVKNVSTECGKAFLMKGVPTYVIGMDNLPGLDEIAMVCGTDQAVAISVGDPAQTNTAFLTALESVRGSTLKCDFAIPQLDPNGNAQLDFEKVNVEHTPSGGTKVAVPRSQDCAFGGGWRYDNPAAPTKVELCPTLCDQVRNDEAAKIDIVFGCATIIF